MASNRLDDTDPHEILLCDNHPSRRTTRPSRTTTTRRRDPHRNPRRRNVLPMAAKNVFICIGYLWSVHVHQWGSPLRSVPPQCTAWTAQAFSSDGWSSRQLWRFSSRALSVNNNPRAERKVFLPPIARSSYRSIGSCSRSSVADAPCSRNANSIWGGGVALPRAARPSLVVCQSTISDETAEADTITAVDTFHSQIINVNGVNGLNGVNENNVSVSIHGDATSNGRHQPELEISSPSETALDLKDTNNNGRLKLPDDTNAELETASLPLETTVPLAPLDIPSPTANGGYTHTTHSKAKISAANKGKVPWNKGKARSPEVKARIAAGVRKRNRETFLAKLAAEGITEEEFERRKKATRNAKDAERRKRRTAKGGYTPTDETRQKISRILKEKYASGEVKRAPRDPSKVRRGFQHSEETKLKISASLKRKWAEDDDYRELMSNKTMVSGHVGRSVRQRISASLKKRWEDPEFRASMLEKFADGRRGGGGGKTRDAAHRKKISDAMKKKWMDEAYRQRVTVGMSKGRESGEGPGALRPARPRPAKMPSKRRRSGAADGEAAGAAPGLRLVTPLSPLTAKFKTTTKPKVKKKKRAVTKRKSKGEDGPTAKAGSSSAAPSGGGTKKKKAAKDDAADGSISRLREERRDLYDLLYGDEEEDELGRAGEAPGEPQRPGPGRGRPARGEVPARRPIAESNSVAALLAEDDNLDDYDPYGLH